MMLDQELYLAIPGEPKTKGSMKCIGQVGKRQHVIIEDHKSAKPWLDALTLWLRKKWQSAAAKGQPLGAEATFTLPRPKAHYRTGRNATQLKPSAPAHPVGHNTGDVDKLLRVVLDALQKADVLPDDCAVLEVTARKAYVVPAGHHGPPDALGYPGVVIRLYPI